MSRAQARLPRAWSARTYGGLVQPVLGRKRADVYVLPETRSAREMLDALQGARRFRLTAGRDKR